MLEDIIIVGIVFSVPIIAIITTHLRKSAKVKYEILQQEIELEKIKQKNYIIETEKMKLELEHMQLKNKPDLDRLLDLRKDG